MNAADATSDGTVAKGDWQHITVVFDQTAKKVSYYINGELDSTKGLGSNVVNSLLNVRLGAHKTPGNMDPHPMRGDVDEFIVFEKALSAEEAKAIYEEKAKLLNETTPIIETKDHWSFDSLTSDMGEGTTGVLNGNNVAIADSGSAIFGKVLRFGRGTDNFMELDNYINTGGKSTSFSMWYRYDTAINDGATSAVLLQHENVGNNIGRSVLTLQSDGRYHTYLNASNVYSSRGVAKGDWQHITVVFDQENKQVSYYINGEHDSTKSLGNTITDYVLPLRLGAHKNPGNSDPHPMRGDVDEFYVFEKVLTAGEAKTIYELKAVELEKESLAALVAEAEEFYNCSEVNKEHALAANLYTSIQNATTVIGNDNATMEEVVAAAEVIENAMSALQLELSFYGASLSLKDNISANFKVNRTDAVTDDYKDVYVKFLFNGKESTVENHKVDLQDSRYVFEFADVAPQCMNDIISADLYAKRDGGNDELIETRTYSISEYCYETLDRYKNNEDEEQLTETGTVKELKTLVVDLLNYGSAAQVYVKYPKDDFENNLVNKALDTTEMEWAKAFATTEIPTLTSLTNVKVNENEIENLKVTWRSAALRLDNSIAVRYKIYVEDSAALENMRVEVKVGEGEPVSISEFEKAEGAGLYYVYFDQLNPGQMSEPLYATVYENSEPVSNTLRYSVESYVAAKQKDEDKNLVSLLNAMIKYGYSVKKYAYEKQEGEN